LFAGSHEEEAMQVREAMSQTVQVVKPDQSIQAAAKMMCGMDIGALPVADGERLVGMITDRDIAVRAVAENKGPGTKVREVMTIDVQFCYDDEDAEAIARHMWPRCRCDAFRSLTVTISWWESWRWRISPRKGAHGRPHRHWKASRSREAGTRRRRMPIEPDPCVTELAWKRST